VLISKKCIYALRALFELALRANNGPVKIHAIAEAQKIPPRFLEIILNQLKHAGFVESRRGNDGGYLLIRDPEDLKIGEIIRFIQGQANSIASINDNLEDINETRGNKAFSELWQEVINSVNRVYDNTSISDLVIKDTAYNKASSLNYSI
jgi:Rrf2 family cysteine metabolism transcriptional repressor